MTDLPGDHPLPHPELTSQTPLIFTVKKGEVLYRHHRADKDAVYFGTSGINCFDDPDCPAASAFGVLYAGEDPHCCFIESCGGTTGVAYAIYSRPASFKVGTIGPLMAPSNRTLLNEILALYKVELL